MPDLTSPPSMPGRWEVRRKWGRHGTLGVFVEAQTAFQAWQEALPKLPGAPSFSECQCTYLGDQAA